MLYVWNDLASIDREKWKCMDLETYNFRRYCSREAFVVENKIVYFGSRHNNATFVLRKEEESEKLTVERED